MVLTGSAARLQKEFNLLAQKSYAAGAAAPPFSGGTITGGAFYGTFYEANLPGPYGFNSEASEIFAFGNNPLNNPGAVGTSISLPILNSYLKFSNGITKSILSAQFRGTLTPVGGPGSGNPFPAFFALGKSALNQGSFPITINYPLQFFEFF